ncbi:MAG TPA: tetratricopeptide repeat protein [Ignavibacteriaceae bacterium]|nr:tetratricopeptide repeat protein [Ignavibacteriaceae bacterium]
MGLFSNKNNEADKYYKSGFDKFRQGDMNGALQDQNKAIELDNNNYKAFHERAVIKVNQKNYVEAIKDFESAIRLNPNDSEYYFGLGYAYVEYGDKKTAKQFFEKAHSMGHSQAKIAINYYCKDISSNNTSASQTSVEFIERNPPNDNCDKYMNIIYSEVHRHFSIRDFYAGYNLITEQFFDDAKKSIFGNAANMGKTSSLGFDLDYILNLYNENKYLFIYYLAIPIDDEDYIIENDMEDFEFASKLTRIVKRQVSTIGAVAHNNHKRCRTFKWFDGFD